MYTQCMNPTYPEETSICHDLMRTTHVLCIAELNEGKTITMCLSSS